MPTAKQELATLYLKRPVDEWIALRRDEGLSWRRIAAALLRETRLRVDVTPETLRQWAKDATR
jgi:hypothetical protein